MGGVHRAEPLGSSSPTSVLPEAPALSFPGPSCWHTIWYSWVSQSVIYQRQLCSSGRPCPGARAERDPPSAGGGSRWPLTRARPWPRHCINVLSFQPHRNPRLPKGETEAHRGTSIWSCPKKVAEHSTKTGKHGVSRV